MATESIRFLSEARLIELRQNIGANRERYAAGNFLDLVRENGWSIETAGVTADYDLLGTLDGAVRSAEADIIASLILYRALQGMTPALACEERIWARLSHVECLGYVRARWLYGLSGDELDKQVRRHVFAQGRTGIRDDNALSRLWWNVYIATIADPDDPEGALRLILKTADIRSNIVERPRAGARRPLTRAIIRAMRRDPWITSSESAFREFMKVINRDGGGILFEALSETGADDMVDACAERAKGHLGS